MRKNLSFEIQWETISETLKKTAEETQDLTMKNLLYKNGNWKSSLAPSPKRYAVLQGRMPIALMATKTSEYKQLCLSNVSKLNPIRQSSSFAKRLWFGYATPINNAAPHQAIVYLGVAKLLAEAQAWNRIAILIKFVRTKQAELSQRRQWASWMLWESSR